MEEIKHQYVNNMNVQYIQGFGVREVASRVWAIDEFGVAFCYLVEGSRKALLIDTGVGMGCLKEVVAALTSKPVEVVNTHFHYDHTGGDLWFEKIWIHKNGVQDVYQNNNLENRKAMFKRQMSRSEYSGCPTAMEDIMREGSFELNPIDEGFEFDLGDKKLQVIFTPGHTNDGICLLDRYNRHLFSGDTIVSTPTLLYKGYSETVETYYESVKKLLARRKEFELIFPGHYISPIGAVYLDDMKKLLEYIMEHPDQPYAWDVENGDERGCSVYMEHAAVVFRPNHIWNKKEE